MGTSVSSSLVFNTSSMRACTSKMCRFRPWEMRPGQYIAEEGPDGQITFPQPEAMESVGLPLRCTWCGCLRHVVLLMLMFVHVRLPAPI